MKGQWKGFISGVIVTLLLAGLLGSAVATGYQKQATLDYTGIKITLDGKTVTPTDASGNKIEPFSIDGTTYLPVRGIASALGIGIQWDQTSQTICLTNGGVPTPSPTPTAAPVATRGNTVYVTKTGKRYHYDSSCNGGTYFPSTLESALKQGLLPCEKCAS